MKLPKLFGKSSTGKTIEWSVEVPESGPPFLMNIYHGQVGGKIQETVRSFESGKNIGRANETTPYEQACSEAKSHWKKQLDKGYVEDQHNIPEPESVEFFLPMLAHRFDKSGHKIDYPAFSQPKSDGLRLLSKKINGKVHLWSRKGKPLGVPQRIADELESVLNEGESLDGELYKHGWDFQTIVSAAKAVSKDTDSLEYHVYDRPVPGISFEERFVLNPPKTTERVKLVETIRITSPKDVEEYLSACLSAGYEGAMIRNAAGLYDFKNRSYDLLKAKMFEDDEFVVIGGKEGTGKDAGTIIFRCLTPEGREFDVRPRGTLEQRSYYWDNLDDFLNKKITIRYQGKSQDLIPRFPVAVRVNPDFDR